MKINTLIVSAFIGAIFMSSLIYGADTVTSDTAISVYSDDVAENGDMQIVTLASDTVTYSVTGGNITFNTKNGAITGCDSSVTSAVIPKSIYGVSVKSIGYAAFRNNTNLNSVSLPSTLTAISVTLDGTDILDNLLHSLNIPSPITVAPCDMVTLVSEVHSLNT